MLGQDSEVPSALVVFDWASCLLYAFLMPVLDVLTEDDTILPTAALVAAKRIAQAPQVDGVSAESPERPWPSLPRPAPGHPGEAATSGARASGLLNDWAGPLQTCPERSLNEVRTVRVRSSLSSGFRLLPGGLWSRCPPGVTEGAEQV